VIDARPWATRTYHSVLALFAPRRALVVRHLDRMDRDPDYREGVLEVLRARGYRHGTSDKQTTPWNESAGPRSGDAELLGDLTKLRNRSRMVSRDDAIGSGLFTTLRSNVIGTGIQDRASTGDDVQDDAVDEVWTELRDELAPADLLDWPSLQETLLDRLAEDGEVWIKASAVGDDDPLSFEVIEAERVETPFGAAPQDKLGQIRGGVERDRNDRVVAYWIQKHHPGANVIAGIVAGPMKNQSLGPEAYDRVPAGDDVFHLRLPHRTGQSHSAPWLHAVLQDIHDLDHLTLAVLKRVQVAACLALFIKSSEAVPELLEVTAENYGYRLDQKLIPGMIFKLWPGEEVQTIDWRVPLTDLGQFVVLLARRIGAALGLPWTIVLKDFSASNYSSARSDILEARPAFAAFERRLIRALAWMRRRTLADAKLRGEARLRGVEEWSLTQAAWIGPEKQWVDPKKEAEAIQIALAIGVTTLRDEAAKRGQDWQELLRQRVKEESLERELREEAGLAVAVALSPVVPDLEDELDGEPEKEPDEDLAGDPEAGDGSVLRRLSGRWRGRALYARVNGYAGAVL